MVYGAPMRRPTPDRAPAAVRVGTVVVASLVVGTAAHLSALGAGSLAAGPVLVLTELLVFVVGGLILAGRWASRRLSGFRWSGHLDDAAAASALVAGQLLVHWAGPGMPRTPGEAPLPGGLRAADSQAGHQHAGMDASALPMDSMGHLSGWGMLAAHTAAALAVGLVMRRLECNVLALVALLRAIGRAVHLVLPRPTLLLTPRMPAAAVADCAVFGRRARRPRALVVLREAVVRRGPPPVLAPAR